MKTAVPERGENRTGKAARHPVLVTALEYLREVLAKEQYEEAPGILAIAREFGATAEELEIVLTKVPF